MTDLPKHLGGHFNRTHVDAGALDYLIRRFGVQSMVDVGCGPGGQVDVGISRGLLCIGIDGDYTVNRPLGLPVLIHDFTLGKPKVEPHDLAWSVEFLEHVEERFMDNYFAVFQQCKLVFVTHSVSPRGHHHVNLQQAPYWIRKFADYGFRYDPVETEEVRRHSTMIREFVKQSGKLFLKA